MNNPVIPAGQPQRVLIPAEVVQQNINTVVSQFPDMNSYDPTTDQGEMIGLRIATDMGVAKHKKDGYRGVLVDWGVAAFESKGDTEGEVGTYPSLALIFDNGDLVRLFGTICMDEFRKLVRAAGKERMKIGIKIVVKKRPSNSGMGAYWTILPDA